MKKLLLLAIAACIPSMAQEYVAYYTFTLAGSAGIFTIQQPAANAKTVRFSEVYVSCSASCTITMERDGSAASTTAITPTKLRATYNNATATVFRDSNVGAGTVIQPGVFINASGGESWTVFDLKSLSLIGNGTGKNVTIKTNSITATVRISVKWSEQ